MPDPVKCYFRFIIPTYNRPSIEKAKQSILNQSFKDVHIVVVHDGSDEGFFSSSYRVESHSEERYTDIYLDYRRWNGGTRNVGIQYDGVQSKYTMFLDDDDFLASSDVLEQLYEVIQRYGEPDLIRLPYLRHYVDEDRTIRKGLQNEIDIQSICSSGKTAPWTKCIQSHLLVPFPENTTHEDVAQHIHQCDCCETVIRFDKPVVVWNIYEGQTSKLKPAKWESSKYRFIADLMDLKLDHTWACQVRDRKLRLAMEALWEEFRINK